MSDYAKPLPEITDLNRPFWDGCQRGELRMQRCEACQHLRYPIATVCPKCLSDEVTWVALSGRGTVFSYLVFHQVYNQAFADDVPYNVALVQLDEGPHMFSNIVGCANDAVAIGDPVEVVFDRASENVTIPRFQKA